MSTILKKGSNGEQVKEVQISLKKLGYKVLVDGDFGPGTDTAIRQFQVNRGITADGIVGPTTAKLLHDMANETAVKVVVKHEAPAKLQVFDRIMPSDQYAKEVTDKKTIYIHHTAGNQRADLVIDGWNSNEVRVGTAYVIGGPDARVADMDGKIYRAFEDKYWCHHLGTKLRNNLQLNKESVGIEVCNWGPLTLKDGKFYNYVNRVVPNDEVCTLDKPFRGFKYYHAYSPKQLEVLKDLILNIAGRYNIPVKKTWTVADFDISADACAGKPGIYNHTNVRTDKTDCSPQPALLAMLNSL
jgi:N-acetyl-anhydromuramyl-L-alanine amidase AmpD